MTTTPVRPVNRLSNEHSRFLRAHASHPVDWYPWGPVAFAAAVRQQKPVLLWIGHENGQWCHRMARESFADPAVAAVINERFIAVTVDRDQRPDIDHTYQLAVQALTQEAGGWPLTAFLTPHDRMPFFGGTFFSAQASGEMPGFADVLQRIADYYDHSAETIRVQSERLAQVLLRWDHPQPLAESPSLDLLQSARQDLERRFDGEYGGFGGAPKFPQPGLCDRLLRNWVASQLQATPDLHALYMAALTLTRIAESGLQDHVQGGFFRHSTDRYWKTPCYEKTLADNSLLLALYARAAVATGDPLYESTAVATADWLLRELRLHNGSFAAGLIGSSAEKPEGPFVWTLNELYSGLGADAAAALTTRFGLDGAADRDDGDWHLYAHRSIDDTARALGTTREAVTRVLSQTFEQLRSTQDRRADLRRDDTGLTAANALAVRGFAIAARAFARPDYSAAAAEAFAALRSRWSASDGLTVSHGDASVGEPAFLNDYAYLLEATLELLETRWRSEDLSFAIALADQLIDRFTDSRDGSLWFSPQQAEALIARPKIFADDDQPSGNGVAARALIRLGVLVGEPRYRQAADGILMAAATDLRQRPAAHAALLDALEDSISSIDCVVLRGPRTETAQWHRELSRLYAPRRMIYDLANETMGLPPALGKLLPSSKPMAHVLRGDTRVESFTAFQPLIRALRDGLELAED
jgi:uncharacterized protein